MQTLLQPELLTNPPDVSQIIDQPNTEGPVDPPKPPTGRYRGDGRSGDDGHGSEEDAALPLHGYLAFMVSGLKSRMKADPDFSYKLFVECALDAIIVFCVNFSVRGDKFMPEIDLTLCQLAISLLSDFALVYLLAPAAHATATARPGTLRAVLESLPAHMFQRTPSWRLAFTPVERIGTLALKAVQYGTVGLVMGLLGTASVHALIHLKEHMDPTFSPPATVQSIVGVGVTWCIFMASSSNVRYNLVNATEDLLYGRSAVAGKVGSIVLRLLNNWAGAYSWVELGKHVHIEEPWKPKKKLSLQI